MPKEGIEETPKNAEGIPKKGEGIPKKGEGIPKKGEGIPKKAEGIPKKAEGIPKKQITKKAQREITKKAEGGIPTKAWRGGFPRRRRGGSPTSGSSRGSQRGISLSIASRVRICSWSGGGIPPLRIPFLGALGPTRPGGGGPGGRTDPLRSQILSGI